MSSFPLSIELMLMSRIRVAFTNSDKNIIQLEGRFRLHDPKICGGEIREDNSYLIGGRTVRKQSVRELEQFPLDHGHSIRHTFPVGHPIKGGQYRSSVDTVRPAVASYGLNCHAQRGRFTLPHVSPYQ